MTPEERVLFYRIFRARWRVEGKVGGRGVGDEPRDGFVRICESVASACGRYPGGAASTDTVAAHAEALAEEFRGGADRTVAEIFRAANALLLLGEHCVLWTEVSKLSSAEQVEALFRAAEDAALSPRRA